MSTKLRRRLQKALKSSDPNAYIEIKNDSGTVQFTIIPSTGEGWIDVLNPDKLEGRAAINKLKGDFESVLTELPQSKWELNPDSPKKQRIYEKWFKDHPYITKRTDEEMRKDAPGYFLDVPFGGSGDIDEKIKAPFLQQWRDQPFKEDGKTKDNIFFYYNPVTKQVVEGSEEGGVLMRTKASGKFKKDGTPIPQIDIVSLGESRARRYNIAYSTASQWMTDEGKAAFREKVRQARVGGNKAHHNIPVEEGPSYFLGKDGLPLSPVERDKRAEELAKVGIFTGNDPRNIYIDPKTGTGISQEMHDYIHNVEYPNKRKGVGLAGILTPRQGFGFLEDMQAIEKLSVLRHIGAEQGVRLAPLVGGALHLAEGTSDVLEGDTVGAGLSLAAAVTGEFPKTEPLSMGLRQTRYTWKQMSGEDKKQFKESIERGIGSLLPSTIDWQ